MSAPATQAAALAIRTEKAITELRRLAQLYPAVAYRLEELATSIEQLDRQRLAIGRQVAEQSKKV